MPYAVTRSCSSWNSTGGRWAIRCVDPLIKDAFVRARAATALLNELEGDQEGMAYEAWFVLDDLDEVRRLVGMPAFSEPISPTAEPTSNPLWDRELD